jgi:hypothetical protein
MKDLGKSKSPDIHDYRAWPLFKEFRKTSEFQALFEEIFEEPLNKVSFDSIDEAEEAIAEQQGVEEEIALAIEPEEAEIADAVIQQS